MYIFSSAFSAGVLLVAASASVAQGHLVVTENNNSLRQEAHYNRLLQDDNMTTTVVTDTTVVTVTEDEEEEQHMQFDGCHCDGSVVHCSVSAEEHYCFCDWQNQARCDADSHGHAHGDDAFVNAMDESSENGDDASKPWGTVIIACLIINLTTLLGVFIIGGHWIRKVICPSYEPKPETGALWIEVIIPIFASGALLSTTFLLILPEALRMIEAEFGGGHDDHSGGHGHRFLEEGHDDHSGENAATWRWGASVMGGFLFPVVLHSFFPHDHDHAGDDDHVHDHVHDDEDDAETEELKKTTDIDSTVRIDSEGPLKESPETSANGSDEEEPSLKAAVVAKTTDDDDVVAADAANAVADDDDDDEYVTIFFGCLRLKNLPLFVSMTLGEMMHNFTDGIFVGAAYSGCGMAMGHSVVLASVFHDGPNQLAGYLVMVNQNGINPYVALGLNFVFGLSVLIGGLMVLIFNFNNVAIGCMLAVGAGVFLHVAIAELLGNAERNVKKPIHNVYMLGTFLFAAVIIGLVLKDHTHC